MAGRIDEARKVVADLLSELESGVAPTETILFKAMRLARLMRDQDAQLWLGYETRGYPGADEFVFGSLGTCHKYAVLGGRLTLQEATYYPKSLPEIEARAQSTEATLKTFESLAAPSVIENFTVKNATEQFINGQLNTQQKYRNAHDHSKALVTSLRSAIHAYATDTYLAIELGDAAQDIFEQARGNVESFIRAHCPRAAEQLVGITVTVH